MNNVFYDQYVDYVVYYSYATSDYYESDVKMIFESDLEKICHEEHCHFTKHVEGGSVSTKVHYRISIPYETEVTHWLTTVGLIKELAYRHSTMDSPITVQLGGKN